MVICDKPPSYGSHKVATILSHQFFQRWYFFFSQKQCWMMMISKIYGLNISKKVKKGIFKAEIMQNFTNKKMLANHSSMIFLGCLASQEWSPVLFVWENEGKGERSFWAFLPLFTICSHNVPMRFPAFPRCTPRRSQ
jgi:hypothetical protein